MTKPESVENQQAAATLCGCTLRDVQRAKRAGCDAFKLGGRIHIERLRAWLRKNPAHKARIPKAKLVTGAAANLGRLEQAEADAFAAMAAERDPDERERRRREWLATGEALRRADLAVDQARREAGQMLLRSDVERDAAQVCYMIFRALEIALGNELPPRLQGLDTVEISVVLKAQLERLRDVINTEMRRHTGEQIAADAFQRIAFSADGIAALHACSRKAFAERIGNEWAAFQDWRRKSDTK